MLCEIITIKPATVQQPYNVTAKYNGLAMNYKHTQFYSTNPEHIQTLRKLSRS